MLALGFDLANEQFKPASPPLPPDISGAQSDFGIHVPTSPLLGRPQEELVAIADADDQRQAEWVEVIDAVNMRSGASS